MKRVLTAVFSDGEKMTRKTALPYTHAFRCTGVWCGKPAHAAGFSRSLALAEKAAKWWTGPAGCWTEAKVEIVEVA